MMLRPKTNDENNLRTANMKEVSHMLMQKYYISKYYIGKSFIASGNATHIYIYIESVSAILPFHV